MERRGDEDLRCQGRKLRRMPRGWARRILEPDYILVVVYVFLILSVVLSRSTKRHEIGQRIFFVRSYRHFLYLMLSCLYESDGRRMLKSFCRKSSLSRSSTAREPELLGGRVRHRPLDRWDGYDGEGDAAEVDVDNFDFRRTVTKPFVAFGI